MSLGKDVIGRSVRERAIITAALRSADNHERKLSRVELECVLRTLDKEIDKIPPLLLPSTYHTELINEKKRIVGLIEKLVNEDGV